MRVVRLHIDAALAPDSELTLPDVRAHHLVQVLRRRVGDPVRLFDGRGVAIDATVLEISRSNVRVRTSGPPETTPAPTAPVTLAQALPKGDGFEEVLQKATELGVDRVQPLLTEHTEYRLPPEAARRARRFERWHQLLVAACEQSGRDHLPLLLEPRAFTDWIRDTPRECWLLDPTGEETLGSLGAHGRGPVTLAVGPEGGWSDAELAIAARSGCRTVALGTPVLRALTAPVAALAMLALLRQQAEQGVSP